MRREAQIGEHVLSDRLGPGEFRVLEVLRDEYRVKSVETGKTENIYKVHCHQTVRMIMRDRRHIRAARIAYAESIGAPKIRPGKKK